MREMNTSIIDLLNKISLGEVQQSGNLTVFPIFADLEHNPNYLTLAEALSYGFEVTELDKGATVAELQVNNRTEYDVLLLDGEELFGAKQNRVLNTTVLVPAASDIVIPVSCTERGRWGQVNRTFKDSEVVMTAGLRAKKADSVRHSLVNEKVFLSDQSGIWDSIQRQQENLHVSAPTKAMRDSYQSKKDELDNRLVSFPCLPAQRGIMAIVNGVVVACDFVSYSPAYAKLHDKLAKSYIMESLVENESASSLDVNHLEAGAAAFLQNVVSCFATSFDSVGLGTDVRLNSPAVLGSSLVVNQTVVHLALFATPNQSTVGSTGRMSSYRQRMKNRGQ